jgi:hypothetical protein
MLVAVARSYNAVVFGANGSESDQNTIHRQEALCVSS